MSRATVTVRKCDRCDKTAVEEDGIPFWIEVLVRIGDYTKPDPPPYDFCSWTCLAGYADASAFVKNEPERTYNLDGRA